MLKQKIVDDMRQAMKAGDVLKRETLRMLDAMIKNTEIEKMKKDKGLNDEEVQAVIARAIKQRRDSMEQYTQGGRPELADKESKEIEILAVYLPAQMGEAEVRKIVAETIAQIGASSKAEIGKVMGPIMGKLKGQADGNLVRKIVEEILQ